MVDFSKPSISKKEIKEVEKVIKTGWITTGNVTQQFANRIRKYVGAKYCLPVSSCTAALHLALLTAGVKEGDEIITTPYTFVATVNTILYLRAKPVFVDIKQNDFILDEDQIEKKITKKTRAVVVVHYAGFSADLAKIRRICKKHNLKLIEDAAHSFGTKYKNELIGKNSEFCCYSFYPTKNITTAEGGALVTNNKKVFEKARVLALHGITHQAWKRYKKEGSWKYDVADLGFKYNLTDINSALGLAQLDRISYFFKHREKLYRIYKKGLSKINNLEILSGNQHSKPFRHLFMVKIKSKKVSRNQFIQKMKRKGIVCSMHFIPVYRFSYYKKNMNIKKKHFPNSENAYKEAVSIPFGSDITSKEAEYVVEKIKQILK